MLIMCFTFCFRMKFVVAMVTDNWLFCMFLLSAIFSCAQR